MEYSQIPSGKLVNASGGSLYKLAILAARRAMILSEGKKSLIAKPGERVLDNSLREISEGKVKLRVREKK